MSELRRLIVRHRHVAPMVSALLASMDAAVTIRDGEGAVILERGGPAGAGPGDPVIRQDVVVDGDMLGWVEGGRTARGIAAVLAYAAARERDKRSLANEALERYRELSLIYDLAATIGGSDTVEPVVHAAVTELSRLPHDARGFVLLVDGDGTTLRTAPGADGEGGPISEARAGVGIVGEAAVSGGSELVEDSVADPRATGAGASRWQPGRGGPARRRRDPGRAWVPRRPVGRSGRRISRSSRRSPPWPDPRSGGRWA